MNLRGPEVGNELHRNAAPEETFSRSQLAAIIDSLMLAAGLLAGWLAWLGWMAVEVGEDDEEQEEEGFQGILTRSS